MRLAVDGDVVVVVDDNELAEAEVTSEGGRLTADTLLQTTVATEDIRVVIDHGERRLVEARRIVRLRHGEANRVADALAKRTSRHLNAIKVVLRMTRRTIHNIRILYKCASAANMTEAEEYGLPI